jgi:hypothetical protein
MTLFARNMLIIANIARIVSAFLAVTAMSYGIYLAINGIYVVGATWIVGAAFFGGAAYMLVGLVAILISGSAAPVVRRR